MQGDRQAVLGQMGEARSSVPRPDLEDGGCQYITEYYISNLITGEWFLRSKLELPVVGNRLRQRDTGAGLTISKPECYIQSN